MAFAYVNVEKNIDAGSQRKAVVSYTHSWKQLWGPTLALSF